MKKRYILKTGPSQRERSILRRSSFKPRYPTPVLEVIESMRRLSENSGGIQYEFDYIGYKPLDHIA